MENSGFSQLGNIGMWELCLTAYVKASESKYVSNVKTNSVACGVLNMIGNKGGVQLMFNFYGHSFNLIDCHLHPGAFAMAQRLAMFQKINRELSKNGLEPDSEADFSMVMGDFNSRFKMKFTEFMRLNKGKVEGAHLFLDELDELREALKDQRFPGYCEGPITFKPTYKCAQLSNDDD